MISNAIDPYMLLARALALIIVIPVHEASHALVAYWLGDSTARNMGRLSLNPIRHFDLMGSISLLIIGIGLNILGLTKLRVLNMMPAVLFPILLCRFL